MAQPNKHDSQMSDSAGNPLIAKTQGSSIAAVTSGGGGATAGAFASATERDAMIVSVNSIISILEANGFVADN